MFFSHSHIFLAISCRFGFLLAPGIQMFLYLLNNFLGYGVIPEISGEKKIYRLLLLKYCPRAVHVHLHVHCKWTQFLCKIISGGRTFELSVNFTVICTQRLSQQGIIRIKVYCLHHSSEHCINLM